MGAHLAACLLLAACLAAGGVAGDGVDPAPGGQVVRKEWRVGIGKHAPDCYVRDVYTINGGFLNESLVVHRGDVLELTVINDIPANYPQVEDGLTIHFHGLTMPGPAAWYDGVPYVHQCPIPAGGRMEYVFRIDDGPGTFQAHSHAGMQISDGLYAPLIILPPRSSASAPWPPRDAEATIMVGDWYHAASGGLGFGLNRPFDKAKVTKDSGAWQWIGNPQAVLFNGKGFAGDCAVGAAGSKTTCAPKALAVPAGASALQPNASSDNPGCAHEEFVVEAGKTYLYRLIGTGSLTHQTICFEGHNVTIVAVDGTPVTPLPVACVDLNLGQRADVLLVADQAPGRYWVTAQPNFRPGSPNGYAVLRYSTAPDSDTGLPATPAPQPGEVKPWDEVQRNKIYSPDWLLDTGVTPPGGGSAADYALLAPGAASLRVPNATRVVRLNNTQPLLRTGQLRWALNNVVSAVTPNCGAYLKNLLDRGGVRAAVADADETAARGPAAADDVYDRLTGAASGAQAPTVLYGRHPALSRPMPARQLVEAGVGDVVDVIIDNLPANANGGDYRMPDGANRTATEQHPFHLHGPHFWLLGAGDGTWDDSKAAQLNLVNPPFRDTGTVFAGGWVYLRVATHAPGAWLFHCHTPAHAHMGQVAVFAVGLDQLGAPPAGLPECAATCDLQHAPWSLSTVRQRFGGTKFDAGPDSKP